MYIPTACHPLKKTRSNSRPRKEGSVYHELGGVWASSNGILGSKASTKCRQSVADAEAVIGEVERRRDDKEEKKGDGD